MLKRLRLSSWAVVGCRKHMEHLVVNWPTFPGNFQDPGEVRYTLNQVSRLRGVKVLFKKNTQCVQCFQNTSAIFYSIAVPEFSQGSHMFQNE